MCFRLDTYEYQYAQLRPALQGVMSQISVRRRVLGENVILIAIEGYFAASLSKFLDYFAKSSKKMHLRLKKTLP